MNTLFKPGCRTKFAVLLILLSAGIACDDGDSQNPDDHTGHDASSAGDVHTGEDGRAFDVNSSADSDGADSAAQDSGTSDPQRPDSEEADDTGSPADTAAPDDVQTPNETDASEDAAFPDGNSSDGNSSDGNSPGHGIQLPPAGGQPDYQLGGAYPPDSSVEIVGRDRSDSPAAGVYSICYINGFQTQPGELNQWPSEAILRSGGQPVMDPDWPDEALLDTSTAAKRAQILSVVKPWLEGCATKGFEAVEFDNLDTYTRSGGRLILQDNLAMAKDFVDEAHRLGLAAGQKNSAEDSAQLKAEAGFDFALVEECAAWQECSEYTDIYGDFVINIEYDDNLPRSFQTMCDQNPNVRSMVMRDRDLRRPGHARYVFETCQGRD